MRVIRKDALKFFNEQYAHIQVASKIQQKKRNFRDVSKQSKSGELVRAPALISWNIMQRKLTEKLNMSKVQTITEHRKSNALVKMKIKQAENWSKWLSTKPGKSSKESTPVECFASD